VSIAKIVEISSESDESFEAAVKTGVKRASKTIKDIRSAWVKDQEVLVKDGKVTGYRVHLKITFELKD
jgi:flavin-binding protein dodecin